MKKILTTIKEKITGLFTKKSLWEKSKEKTVKFVSKNKKLSIIIGSVLLIIIIGLIVRFSFFEDNWLCVNNAWVKHGNPSSVPPGTGCGSNKSVNFVASGNLVKDNPGMKSGVSYLIYDRPNNPGLSVELTFGKNLDSSAFKPGQRVFVEGFEQNNTVVVQNITPERSLPEGQQVKLYYYNSKLDTDKSGNVLCSKKGLVAVNRTIPKIPNIIQNTIRFLIMSNLPPKEKAEGLSTNFPLPGVTLVSTKLDKGVLTITLNDLQNKTSGGSCRVSIMRAEIEATAMQFPEVKSVKFTPSTLFQP